MLIAYVHNYFQPIVESIAGPNLLSECFALQISYFTTIEVTNGATIMSATYATHAIAEVHTVYSTTESSILSTF